MLEIQASPQGHEQKRAQKGRALLSQHSNSFRAVCPSAEERSWSSFPTSRQIPKPQTAGTFPMGALTVSPKAWNWAGDSGDMGTVALGTRLGSTAAATGTGDATPGAGSGCWAQHFPGWRLCECHPWPSSATLWKTPSSPPGPWMSLPASLGPPPLLPCMALTQHTASPSPPPAATGALPSPHCLPKTLQSCSHPVPRGWCPATLH